MGTWNNVNAIFKHTNARTLTIQFIHDIYLAKRCTENNQQFAMFIIITAVLIPNGIASFVTLDSLNFQNKHRHGIA